MNESRYCFPAEQIESDGTRSVRMSSGFFLERATPLLALTIEEIMGNLPEETKKVFPANVEKTLRETGMDSNFEVTSNLRVAIHNIWKDDERDFDWSEFRALDEIRIKEPAITLHGICRYWFVDKEKKDAEQLLGHWISDDECVIGGKKFWIVEGLDEKLRKLKKYLEISSLDMRVSVIAKGVGDFVCNFQVFISSKDGSVRIEGSTYGSKDGKWDLMIGGYKKTSEGNLSFEEAAGKLKTAAEEFERKRKERMEAETRGIEGLKLLFA